MELVQAISRIDDGAAYTRSATYTQSDSDIIQIGKVLCIFFMVYVHLYPGLEETTLPKWMEPFRAVLVDLFGRASVPLLSLFSGFLAISSFSKRGYKNAILVKAGTLMSTLALWNVLAIAFGLIVWSVLRIETNFLEALNQAHFLEVIYSLVLSADNGSIQISHAFLRDLFMCFVLLPVIQLYCRTFQPVYGMPLLYAGVLLIGTDPVIYRDHVLLYFVAGVYMYQCGFRLASIERWAFLVLPALFVFAGIELFGYHQIYDLHSSIQLAKRIAVAAAFLLFSSWLSTSSARRLLLEISRPVFIVFLSHNIALAVLWGVWTMLMGWEITSAYAFYFFAAPVLVWIIAYAVYPALLRIPRVLRVPLIGK